MIEMDERRAKFINYLLSLSAKEDRGALADLRTGLRTDPGHAPRMHKHVCRFLGDKPNRSDRWFYVIGALFGSHPKHVSKNSMGKCFKALSDSGSESIESRFLALLEAHPDDLHHHLYHAIGLLRSREIGVDYYKLLNDLIEWHGFDHRVQNGWARDYYWRADSSKKEKEIE